MVRLSTLPILLITSFTLTSAQTVQEVISGRPELSLIQTITTRFPALLTDINENGGTFLAPTNEALTQYFAALNMPADPTSLTEATARDLFSYHSLPLSLRGADLSRSGGALVDTGLLKDEFANLGGGPNVVFASAFGSTGQDRTPSGLRFYSGVGTPANVTVPDVPFDAGFVHIIDRVLNLPQNCTTTAEIASLSTLLSALQLANLTEVVDTTPKFTCFAPSDAAFQAAGIDVEKLTTEQLVDALKYHSIVGDVGYSTAFEDGKEYQTLLGVPVTVRKREGKMFINEVEVARGNVIMNNGVAHVLNGVLTPPRAPTTSSANAPGPRTTITTLPSPTRVPAGSSAIRAFESGTYFLVSAIAVLTGGIFML